MLLMIFKKRRGYGILIRNLLIIIGTLINIKTICYIISVLYWIAPVDGMIRPDELIRIMCIVVINIIIYGAIVKLSKKSLKETIIYSIAVFIILQVICQVLRTFSGSNLFLKGLVVKSYIFRGYELKDIIISFIYVITIPFFIKILIRFIDKLKGWIKQIKK